MKKILVSLLVIFIGLNFASAQKVAFVDSEYILSNIPSYKAAQDEIDKLAKEWQLEVENIMTDVERMYKSYQAEKVLLTDDMKTKRENDIIQKEREAKQLKNEYFGPEGLLFKKRKEKIGPIQDEVYRVIKELANENNYAGVFDTSAGPIVLFSNPRYDISDDVLTRLGYKN